MNWDFPSLLGKAKYYFHKALAEPRANQEFGLFAAFALEFLGRAALAKIHPVLLADGRDGGNIMSVFGFVKPNFTPKSVPAKTVFDRCTLIVADFVSDDSEFSNGFVQRRNGELHGGDMPFADYGTEHWLANYYTIVQKLCVHCGIPLDEFVGDAAETATAREMISAAIASVRTEVESLVRSARTAFEKLSDGVRKAKVDAQNSLELHVGQKPAECPSCGAKAVVSGRKIKSTPPRLEDDCIITEETYLPDTLECDACGLRLSSHAQLHAIGLGGQYHEETVENASEYYERMYGSEEADWDDYGND